VCEIGINSDASAGLPPGFPKPPHRFVEKKGSQTKLKIPPKNNLEQKYT